MYTFQPDIKYLIYPTKYTRGSIIIINAYFAGFRYQHWGNRKITPVPFSNIC